MKIYIEEELQKVEQDMIEHFEENGIEYDSIYLLEKDYFPQSANDLQDDADFAKWFYYFQGQYHKLQDIFKFLDNE